ncbi:MAG: glycerophosphodiester phosphodiesterase family protein [Sphingobium sp.]
MSPEAPAPFLSSVDYAHRGLHGPPGGFAENSLPAFSAAFDRGLGAECDVRLSADGIAFVFHDERLERMTGEEGAFASRRAVDLDTVQLNGGGGAIPRLSLLLRLAGKEAPLLIEVKISRGEAVAPLCAAVLGDLEGHEGPAAVMSFHPGVSRWFAVHAPKIPRGLVVTEEKDRGLAGSIKRRLAMAHARPDFLAYDIRDLPSPFAARARKRGLPVLSWTVRDEAQWASVRAHADAAIFEGDPEKARGR